MDEPEKPTHPLSPAERESILARLRALLAADRKQLELERRLALRLGVLFGGLIGLLIAGILLFL
jgi:hypothetical protein